MNHSIGKLITLSVSAFFQVMNYKIINLIYDHWDILQPSDHILDGGPGLVCIGA